MLHWARGGRHPTVTPQQRVVVVLLRYWEGLSVQLSGAARHSHGTPWKSQAAPALAALRVPAAHRWIEEAP